MNNVTERQLIEQGAEYIKLVQQNKHILISEKIVFYLSVVMGYIFRLFPIEFTKRSESKVRNHAWHWWGFIQVYNVWAYHVLARVILPAVQVKPHRLNSYLGKTNPEKMR